MIYRKLLLSAGGGIVSEKSKVEPGNCVILNIGLGGVGIDCLKSLKKEVCSLIKTDDYGCKEGNRNIKYLAIDVDDEDSYIRNEIGESLGDLDDDEFISIFGDYTSFGFVPEDIYNKREDLNSWLNMKSTAFRDLFYDNSHGAQYPSPLASGIRQIARFLMFEKIGLIIDKLNIEIEELLNYKTQNCINSFFINVFSSASGKTGSGIFLDICYILRDIIKHKSLSGKCYINGFILLPDVLLSKPFIHSNNLLTQALYRNGYAFLKELDYCMRFDENGDCWEQIYGKEKIKTTDLPVDVCYLVSSRTMSGNIFDYQDSINTVSSFCFQMIANPDFYLHACKHENHLNDSHNDGANHRFVAIGSCSNCIPTKEVNTYLATTIIGYFKKAFDIIPSQEDVKSFSKEIDLTYDSLRKKLFKGASPEQFAEIVKGYEIKYIKSDMSLVIQSLTDCYEKIGEHQEINVSNITQPLNKSYYPSKIDGEESIISGIFNTLFLKYLYNSQYGPVYCHNLLCSLKIQDLTDIIRGIQIENNEKMRFYNSLLEKRRANMESAEIEWLNRKNIRRAKNYLLTVVEYYTNKTVVDSCYRLGNVLNTLKVQIQELEHDYFNPLCSVIKSIIDTFDENSCALKCLFMYDSNLENRINYSSLSTLKPMLDKEINCLSYNAVYKEFLYKLAQTPENWISQESNKIVRFINAFFTETVFPDIHDKLLVDFRKVVEQSVKNGYLDYQKERAEELFWKNPYYSGCIHQIDYILVPENDPFLYNTIQSNKDSTSCLERGHLNDRVIFIRITSSLPICYYGGIYMGQENYCFNYKQGTHIYERGTRNRYWIDYLPDPIPASLTLRERKIERIEKYKSDSFELLEKCIKAKTISEDSDGIRIFECDYDELKEKLNRVKALYDRNRTEDAEMLFSSVKEVKDSGNFKHSQVHLIAGSNKGLHIARDKFVSFPKYRDIASEEFKKYEEFMKLYNETEKLFASKEDYPTFRDAYFVGLIKFKPLYNVKLEVKDEFGFVMEEEILCDPNMVHKTVPIYQAYLTFKQLPDEIKSTVKSKCAEYMEFSNDNMNQQVLDNIDVVSAKFNETYITAIQEAARNLPNPREATMFIQKFISEFKAFEKQIKSSF